MATSVPFSMRMDETLNEDLKQEAQLRDRPASYVVSKAVKEFLAREKRERTIMLERLKEADKGEFISEEAMTEWFLSLGSENELPEPKADVFIKHL